MKRVAFIGSPGHTPYSFARSFDQVFRETGGNTGNLAFWYAVARHFTNEREFLTNWNFDPARIRADFDVVALPSSNFLHPDRDMGPLADKLDKCELPLFVVGLGAQAAHMTASVRLKPGTERFIRLLAERSDTIGVRGSFTGRILEDRGISNYAILGCPSNLINLSPGMALGLEQAYAHVQEVASEGNWLNIAVCADLHRTGQHWLSRRFYEWAKLLGSTFVCQHPDYLVRAAREPHWTWTEGLERIRLHVFADLSQDAFRAYVGSHFVSFFSAEPWLEHSKRFHLSLGTRFHGNMLALQAGVPSVFISHDSRTAELSEACGVPSVWIDDCRDVLAVKDLLRRVRFRAGDYDEKRRRVARDYVGVLRRSELVPTPELVGYVGESRPAQGAL